MTELTYLYGKPAVSADIRTHNSDFQVKEILPFLPDGEGEHHLLHIRKDGLNTAQVAEMISRFAKVHPKEVTFAGQKDKNAITEQWFGVRIPGKETPDWAAMSNEQMQVLSFARHGKKLRTGALSGNRFTLVLRNVSDPEALVARLELVRDGGVPNYFGEQRFGHDGGNLVKARQMFEGRKVKDRNKRSLYLSAVRSELFNQVASARLARFGTAPIEGDCVMLSGSRSFFTAESWDDSLNKRLAEQDIQLSAPLWGRGEQLAKGDAAALESSVLAAYELERNGLEKEGLTQERRALLLRPEQLSFKLDGDALTLDFCLPAGAFATSVLRELCEYTDIKELEWRRAVAERDAREGDNAPAGE
ncbi:tRNA pseudouridine(13) synthase TruD [Shewanella amazonensis]|uniref:tRNA pseudouridine synthase D n=1 Tax=Shewanella amazonensis (strain ATCC BAA-1098 / SB2B) TaxID=326297 RepID=A1S4E1_SHEAM|nr:tRNA pseudouridine(13) synthase TruD [Shewanella amazonensis]ABL99247.1 pseudouridylate synthase [Shewanella amazonensis SB2B]